MERKLERRQELMEIQEKIKRRQKVMVSQHGVIEENLWWKLHVHVSL